MEKQENEKRICSVKDLGMAAYLKMQGFVLLKRRNKEFFFEVREEETDQFDKNQIDYVNSVYAAFDNEIMNLKKLPF